MSSTKNPGRFAGLLYVLFGIPGFFAMEYVPGKLIVHGNAVATASNIAASETLFRPGIAAQLICHAGFIFVVLALYHLLKEINIFSWMRDLNEVMATAWCESSWRTRFAKRP